MSIEYYIYPTIEIAAILNDAFFDRYVFVDNEYQPPFKAGTTEYLNYAYCPWKVNALMNGAVDDLTFPARELLIAELALKKTLAEAIAAGWFGE